MQLKPEWVLTYIKLCCAFFGEWGILLSSRMLTSQICKFKRSRLNVNFRRHCDLRLSDRGKWGILVLQICAIDQILISWFQYVYEKIVCTEATSLEKEISKIVSVIFFLLLFTYVKYYCIGKPFHNFLSRQISIFLSSSVSFRCI